MVREINQKQRHSHNKAILDIKAVHKKQMNEIVPKFEALTIKKL